MCVHTIWVSRVCTHSLVCLAVIAIQDLMYMYIHVYVYICIRIYMYTYMHVYVYI